MNDTNFKAKYERIQKFRPIDDNFFELLIQEPGVCEEMLRILLEDPVLTVVEIYPQKSIRQLINRSVRLDALCKTGRGELVNIEIQTTDDDDHFKRVRYNAALTTVKTMETGKKFKDTPTVYSLFISKFDIFKSGYPIYHIKKFVEETQQPFEDGHHIIFANTEVDNQTRISSYLGALKQQYVDEKQFPSLGKGINYLKNNEKGVLKMCELMEEYAEEYAKEYAKEGRINIIISLITKAKLSKEMILASDFSEEEYEKALEKMRNE